LRPRIPPRDDLMTIPSNDVAATLDEIAERIRGAPDRYERAIAITAFRIACRENGTALNPALEAANIETSLLREDARAPGCASVMRPWCDRCGCAWSRARLTGLGSGSLPSRRIRLTRNTKSAPPGGFRSLLQRGFSEVATKSPIIASHSPREASCGKLIWSSRVWLSDVRH
jgi:hypothetical protein